MTVIRVAFFRGRPGSASSESARSVSVPLPLSAPLPRRWKLQTPDVVRHLPRCRLFPPFAPAARLGRGPPVRSLRNRADSFRPLRVGTGPARGPSGSSRYGRTPVLSRVRPESESSMRAALADTTRRIAFVVFGPGRRGSRASISRAV